MAKESETMVSEAPPFWWTKADWRAWALSPAAFVYGQIAGRRMLSGRRQSIAVPVICVGNFTVGGAGKTPTALTLAKAARAKGLKPGFLSRGYGGSLDVTTVVDPDHHRAGDVGDEPLLLGREALTVIYRKGDLGVHYTVVDGDKLEPPDGARRTEVGDTTVWLKRDGDVLTANWVRDGHTCVLATKSADEELLLAMVDWT